MFDNFICWVLRKKNCEDCQYFRNRNAAMPVMTWCSNIKSENCLKYVGDDDICDQFTKRGKKAPLWMRALNKVMK